MSFHPFALLIVRMMGGDNGDSAMNWHRYGSIWATLGLPKKFTPWSFESFSHFFLDFSKKKAKIFEI